MYSLIDLPKVLDRAVVVGSWFLYQEQQSVPRRLAGDYDSLLKQSGNVGADALVLPCSWSTVEPQWEWLLI